VIISQPNRNCYAHCYCDSDRNRDAYCNADANASRYTHGDTDSHPYAEAYIHAQTSSNAASSPIAADITLIGGASV
jgi:hypothetical protein